MNLPESQIRPPNHPILDMLVESIRRRRSQKHELVMSALQRAELECTARQSRSARSVAFRTSIALKCTEGASNAAVAAKLRTTGFIVGHRRNRSIAEGVVGLGDEPRPGAPHEICDGKVEHVVRSTSKKTPKGGSFRQRTRSYVRAGAEV
jgi:hypothetical protein